MQPREKILALLLAAVVGGYWIVPGLYAWAREPVVQRESELKSIQRRLDVKEQEEIQTLVAVKKLDEWKRHSLPSDELAAERVYVSWMTDLADGSGWKNVRVTPVRRRTLPKVGTAISVQVEASAPVALLTQFLERFTAAPLEQSVIRLDLKAESVDADDPLSITLTAEALSLLSATPPPLPFRGTSLIVAASAGDDQLTVAPPVEPSTATPFNVLMGDQTYAVIELLDEGRAWKLETPLRHSSPIKTEITFPADETSTASTSGVWGQFRSMSPFAIPKRNRNAVAVSPKKNEPPRLSVPSEEAMAGKPWTVTATATDPDGDSSGLSYGIENAPEGVSIDRQSGHISWVPPLSQAGKSVELSVLATDSGSPPATTTKAVTVNVSFNPASTTQLIGVIKRDGEMVAWLFDTRTGQRTDITQGSVIDVGTWRGTVTAIESEAIVMTTDTGDARLELGQTLIDAKR